MTRDSDHSPLFWSLFSRDEMDDVKGKHISTVNPLCCCKTGEALKSDVIDVNHKSRDRGLRRAILLTRAMDT